MRHAFVVSAYGESAYLSECLDSIVKQRDQASEVLITTSTPSKEIESVAKRFGVSLLVNSTKGGIASDWNFALTGTAAELVTIVHQDDVYENGYASAIQSAFRHDSDTIIAFTNHRELTDRGPRATSLNLRVKRLLTYWAFFGRKSIETRTEKTRLLSLGNPVCCPSVTFNRGLIPEFRFCSRFKSNLDWEAWHELARIPGKFSYIPQILVSKRVHPSSETTALLANELRQSEDLEMLRRFWPEKIAVVLAAFYAYGYKSNVNT
jgi:hypothetical protein